jgi:hypothetical protein
LRWAPARWLLLGGAFAVVPLGCNQQGCGNLVEIADNLRDDDADDWFDASLNQRVDLFVDSVTFVSGGGLIQPSGPRVIVDDREITGNFNFPASVRTLGTWLFQAEGQSHQFTSRVKVFDGDSSGVDAETVSWTNSDGTFTSNVGGFDVTFRTEVHRFADPSPGDADADGDLDGILEREESRLAMEGQHPAGNPMLRDIVMVVTYTHPVWKLTVSSREKLTTAFLLNGAINLVIADDHHNPFLNLHPGVTGFIGASEELTMNLSFARTSRDDHIHELFLPFTHHLALTEKVTSEDGFLWGRASSPGLTLVCRSHLPVGGPDLHDYQATDILHELGHNLGLCHPTESTAADCATGAIPASERDPALSAMGSPAESSNPFESGWQAILRPLDYTPTQWSNLRPDFSREIP